MPRNRASRSKVKTEPTNPTNKSFHSAIAAKPQPPVPPPIGHDDPHRKSKCRRFCRTVKFWAEPIGVVILAIYTTATVLILGANKRSADAAWRAAGAATNAANTAATQLELAERPWV